MPRSSIIFSLALLALAFSGCQTSSRKATRLTELPEHRPFVAPVEGVPPAPPPTLPKSPPPPSPLLLVPPKPAFNPWISWQTWSQSQGYGVPQRLISATNSYQLKTAQGTLSLIPGSHLAYWNGVEHWLGFAPGLTNGQIFVHSLDAQKNFQPLLSAPKLALGASRTVVIDPGHGGENVGTRSVVSERFEKEFTLDWAMRLQPLLAAKGWTVFLTRTNDTDVSLSNRVAIAEFHQADLFLSLHFNSASPKKEQAGLETYCLTPAGMASNLTRGFEDDLTLVLPNNAFDAENLHYAARLHRALVQATGRTDRGLRRARFMGVLRGQMHQKNRCRCASRCGVFSRHPGL